VANIVLRDLRHSYMPEPKAEADWALKRLAIDWADGGAYALLGPSGCGKTTLLNLISGLLVPTEGRILFKGEDITSWPTDVRGKAGVFLAFQYPEEIPGVPMIQFLRQALSARKGIDLSVLELRLSIMDWMKKLGMDVTYIEVPGGTHLDVVMPNLPKVFDFLAIKRRPAPATAP